MVEHQLVHQVWWFDNKQKLMNIKFGKYWPRIAKDPSIVQNGIDGDLSLAIEEINQTAKLNHPSSIPLIGYVCMHACM